MIVIFQFAKNEKKSRTVLFLCSKRYQKISCKNRFGRKRTSSDVDCYN